MGVVISLLVFLIITFAFLRRKHYLLVTLCILSIFADNFRFNIGPSLLIANMVGFLVIPIVLKDTYIFKHINRIIRPLWWELLYLIFLGYIFGFLLPWDSLNSDYRLWNQKAGGRSVVTIFRLISEFFLAYYIIWCFVKKKINLKFIVYVIGYISFCSIIIGLMDFFTGYWFKSNFLFFNPSLANRFLGLNGEPKVLGRNSALAYALILLYYFTHQKDKKLIVFIVTNALGVIMSLSASAIILFMVLNLVVFFNRLKPTFFIFFTFISLIISFALQNNPFVTEAETTRLKIEKALYGIENKVIPDEPKFFSRFDIFDRLGLVFLYENPKYLFIGTGPNLISIPASKYVHSLPEYSSYAKQGGIDSVPNVMINNILARSGIIGIIFFTIFYVRLFSFSKLDKTGFSKSVVFISFFFNMVYFSIVLLFLTSVIVGYIYTFRSNSKNNLKVLD